MPFHRVFPSCLLLIVITAFVVSVGTPAFASAPLQSKGLQLLEEIQEAISELAEHVTPTVVGVSAIRQISRPGKMPSAGRFKVPGAGSGVVIHEDGYIVTNQHVINNGVEAEVHFSDQSTLVAKIVAQDPDTDLALLKVEDGSQVAECHVRGFRHGQGRTMGPGRGQSVRVGSHRHPRGRERDRPGKYEPVPV